jgi:acyl-coenzyme A thioesterase PaaI-like protein
MDPGALKSLIEERMLFCRKVGLRLLEASEKKVRLGLPDDASNGGAIGLVHPAALYALLHATAEAMALTAFGHSGLLVELSAEVRYLRVARGAVEATCHFAGDAVELLAEAAASGGLDVPLEVEAVEPDEGPVAEARVVLRLRPVGDTVR